MVRWRSYDDRQSSSVYKNNPAFPETVFKALQLVRSGDYSVMDMANVIKYDPSITANILKMSNSAYFGSRQKIKQSKMPSFTWGKRT